MGTTAISTGDDNAAVNTLPSPYRERIMGYLDERDEYRAGRSAGGKAKNAASGEPYKAAIFKAFAALSNDCPPNRRSTKALEFMALQLDAGKFDLPELPVRRTVDKYKKLFFK